MCFLDCSLCAAVRTLQWWGADGAACRTAVQLVHHHGQQEWKARAQGGGHQAAGQHQWVEQEAGEQSNIFVIRC